MNAPDPVTVSDVKSSSPGSSGAPGPAYPVTPWDALGPLVRDRILIKDQEFTIARPAESDRLIDNPVIREQFAADEYLPYWADLWPASRMLGKAILAEPWEPGLEALEIGCGLGLPGIVALSRGLRVVFSDCDATALRFAADNARANGFTNFRTLQLDWRHPPADLKVPVVLASDLIYELRNVEPLVGLIRAVLAPGGLCLLTDQDRPPSHTLPDALRAAGLVFTTKLVRAGEPPHRRFRGTLYRITTGARP